MTRVSVPFIGGRHIDRAIQVNAQRCVNWMPATEGDEAKSVLVLDPTPGLDLVRVAGNGPCRSDFVTFGTSQYFVSGSQLMKMAPSTTYSAVGNIGTTAGRCYISAGRNYLMMVDGAKGYYWDGSTFGEITGGMAPGFPANPIYCGFMDGYFIVISLNSDIWSISTNEDPRGWATLDYRKAEAHPDDAVAIITTFRDVYIIGTVTTEVYYDSGNVDFPFELYANGVLEFGTAAPASVAKVGGNIFLLAQVDGGGLTVLRVNGFQAQRVADPDIAYTLGRMTVTSDAEGLCYTEDDQTFYELTFPTEDITLVYHVEQGMWHDRKSYGIGRHRILGHGRFQGHHYVGDYDNNNVYRLNTTTYTENEQPILRMRSMGAVHKAQRDFEVHAFEVEFVRGVGLVTGQGSNPMCMLRYSWNGGKTWSQELWRPIGAIGDDTCRAIWNRLGQGADFRAELSVSDPIEAIVIGAYMDTEVLSP